MKKLYLTCLLLICTLLSACGSPNTSYNKSAEQQKAEAEKAQRELSRETSR